MGRPKKTDFVQEESSDAPRKVYLNAGEVQQEIEKLEKKGETIDKRTKEFDIWREEINILFDLYNKEVGFKAYKKL